MRATPWMLIGFAIVAAAPSAALAQKVSYDYDHKHDFSRMKTYALRQDADSEKHDNPLVDQRIASAVIFQLEARGMVRDEARPDVYVVVNRTFETEKRLTSYNSGYGPYMWNMGWNYGYGFGGYGYGWPGYSDVYVRDVVIGTLTIDLVDTATNRLVWRGLGRMTERPTSKPSRVTKRVNHEVEEIFENFPAIAR